MKDRGGWGAEGISQVAPHELDSGCQSLLEPLTCFVGKEGGQKMHVRAR